MLEIMFGSLFIVFCFSPHIPCSAEKTKRTFDSKFDAKAVIPQQIKVSASWLVM